MIELLACRNSAHVMMDAQCLAHLCGRHCGHLLVSLMCLVPNAITASPCLCVVAVLEAESLRSEAAAAAMAAEASRVLDCELTTSAATAGTGNIQRACRRNGICNNSIAL